MIEVACFLKINVNIKQLFLLFFVGEAIFLHLNMTSVLNSVTSWLGGSRERDRTPPGETEKPTSDQKTADDVNKPSEGVAENSDKTEIVSSAPSSSSSSQVECSTNSGATDDEGQKTGTPFDVNLHDVSEKAVYTAKEWGSTFCAFVFGTLSLLDLRKISMSVHYITAYH